MTAFGHAELTVKELPDELQFRVNREHGWFMLVALPAICLFAALVSFAVPDRETGFGIALTCGFCFLVSAILAAVYLKQGVRTTTLSVTSQLFEAKGAGLGSFLSFGSSRVVIRVPQISAIRYTSGDDDPSGLEVRCGFWKSKVLLPGLDREQTRTVIDAISRRFPEIGAKVQAKG